MADGRHSVTHYETLEAHRFASLLEIHLETGRTHQIRVHMAALKHPCVGDLTYGADPALAERVGLERQWLHAVRLGFEHPDTGEYVEYESTYPDDLASALEVDPRCPLMRRPGAPAGDGRGPAGASPTLYLPRRARGRPGDAARRPHRRRGPRLGRGRLRTSTQREVWWPSGRRRAARLRRARPTTGSTTCTSRPTTPARASARALLDLVKALRPDGFCLWVFESNTAGPRASTRATGWSSWSAPTARQRGEGARRPDGLARAPTRSRSSAA